jgi:hypothetical protein
MSPSIPVVPKQHRVGEIRQFWNAAGVQMTCE